MFTAEAQVSERTIDGSDYSRFERFRNVFYRWPETSVLGHKSNKSWHDDHGTSSVPDSVRTRCRWAHRQSNHRSDRCDQHAVEAPIPAWIRIEPSEGTHISLTRRNLGSFDALDLVSRLHGGICCARSIATKATQLRKREAEGLSDSHHTLLASVIPSLQESSS